MKKIALLLLAFTVLPFLGQSQSAGNIAHEAFMITRMVDKFHVDPKPVDSKFSAAVFSAMLDNADPDRIYFIKGDIDRLASYQKTLDREILLSKTGYLSLFTAIYETRLKMADSLVDIVTKNPFNFYLTGKLTAAEDTTAPASVAAIRQKLGKKLQAEVLDDLVDGLPADFKTLGRVKQKAYVDSAEAPLRKKLQHIECIAQSQVDQAAPYHQAETTQCVAGGAAGGDDTDHEHQWPDAKREQEKERQLFPERRDAGLLILDLNFFRHRTSR